MARRPSDDPKCEHITLRLTRSERERLDADRGSLSITDYIRSKLFRGR